MVAEEPILMLATSPIASFSESVRSDSSISPPPTGAEATEASGAPMSEGASAGAASPPPAGSIPASKALISS